MKALLIFIFLLFASQASATTYYVAKTGSGSACTSAVPCLTIATGLSKLAAGDTLQISAGTYAETINRSQVPSGTSWANATIIRAASSQDVIITGTGGLSPLAFQSPGAGITKEYIIFQGTGTHNLIFDTAFSGVNGVVIGGGANGGTLRYIRVDGVTVRNVTGSAVFLGDEVSTDHLEFINSVIHDWTSTGTPPQHHGIYAVGPNQLIENNLIYNGEGYGLHLFNSGGSTTIIHDNRITRNIVHDVCKDPGGCCGIIVGFGANNEVSNNLVYNIHNGGDGGGICPSTFSTNMLVYGNTIYNTDYYGINTFGSTNAVIKNNILSTVNTGSGNVAFSDLGSGASYDNNLCSTAGTHCEFVESSASTFVTPGTTFTLKAGSLAINAGGTTPTGIPYNVDLLNIARPQGAAYDLGALELATGAPIPTVNITQPTGCVGTSTACTVTGSTVTVAGTSSITDGSVAFTCDRCTVTSGNATGVPASWILPQLTLKVGINVITVTHTTAAGGVGSDTITITYAPTFPGNALVAAYSFDAGSGTTAADASGNGNTGTLANGPTWNNNGRFGKAVQFNGSTQYISVPDSNTLDFTQSFSITLYVMPTVAQTDFRGLVIKNASPITNPYALYASSTGACGDGAIAGYSAVNGASGPSNVACSATPLQINVWTHLALTWNGSTGTITLYKNGVSVATTTQTGYVEPSAGTLQIAATEFGEYFQGLIDEIRIYNYAIPATGGANVTFGSNCARADETTTPSVIGDANCSITPLAPPLAFKIGSAAANFKQGASSSLKIGAQ